MTAARAVAAAHGVAGDDAVVLPGSSNVLVHLRPAPVVARVMTATAGLHADPGAWLAREVAVGTFLGDRGLAVAPSDLLPPGPHERDGLWLTFWRHVAHDAAAPAPGPAELGGALRTLHDALAGYPGRLGELRETRDWLAGLQPPPALRARLDALTPAVFASALPVQAIHGDASLSNLLRTPDGLRWNDLEDVCVGPVHWDLAGLVEAARGQGRDETHVPALLDAYGGPGLAELEPFVAAHRLYRAIWRARGSRATGEDRG